jgi:hypothetical protein
MIGVMILCYFLWMLAVLDILIGLDFIINKRWDKK